jgi:hypothetical protein
MGSPVQSPQDARGKRIRLGSMVRIVGTPDLSSIRSRATRLQLEDLFEHLRGQCKRVVGFGRYGHAEISLRVRRGMHAGLHFIEIEPNLLLVQKRRARRDSPA